MTPGTVALAGLLADRYQLGSRIAGGGMGEVWRAHDLVLDRPVAVKTLRTDLDDAEGRRRLRAEARAAARLVHPGIASVYDFGESGDSAWLVLELVDGEPLSAVLARERRLDPDRTLDVLAHAASALHAAHEAGVVHRDVKPGNLMLPSDGAVKLTDFGIASTAGTTTLTRTGEIVGTAGYLSPEQAEGRGATPASDLYALGVVAYECLAGKRPFTAEAAVAVLHAHLRTAPPPLPDDVPAPVAALVLRMLAKDPSRRPASAGAVAAEAQALRRSATRVSAAPDGPATAGVHQPAAPVDAPATSPPPGGAVPAGSGAARAAGPVLHRATSRRTQRRAVRTTTLLLAVLAVVLGLSSSLRDEQVAVPRITPGTPVDRALAVLTGSGLQARQQPRPSPDVAAGRVLAQRPAAGTELERGAVVVLVVSSGPGAAASATRPAGAGAPAPTTAGEDERSVEGRSDEATEEQPKGADKAREKEQGKGKGKGKGRGKGRDGS